MSSFEESLEAASADWVSDGVITEAQRAAILQRHPVTESGSSRFVAILATVGGLLLAVGVSLIIKANWHALGDWTKIGGLVVLLLAAYGVGWKLKVVEASYPKVGDMLLMVGALFFLGGITLVSQVFHLNSRPATGVMIWWLGIAAVPWLARAKGAQFVSIVALLVWLGMEMTTAGSWIEVTVKTAGFTRHDFVAVQAVFALLGLALWLAGLALRGTRHAAFAAMHEGWGVVVFCGALYWLGFARHEWRWAHGAGAGFQGSAWPAMTLALILVGTATVLAWRHRRGELQKLLPWLVVALVPVLGVVGLGALDDGGWLWSALAWLSLFVLSVALVRVGLESGREGWVNLGIGFIALNILTRYFDLFGTMLEGGVFFIVTGVLVIGLGIYLERKRRALVTAMRKEAA